VEAVREWVSLAKSAVVDFALGDEIGRKSGGEDGTAVGSVMVAGGGV
jgi:hypothetical protein